MSRNLKCKLSLNTPLSPEERRLVDESDDLRAHEADSARLDAHALALRSAGISAEASSRIRAALAGPKPHRRWIPQLTACAVILAVMAIVAAPFTELVRNAVLGKKTGPKEPTSMLVVTQLYEIRLNEFAMVSKEYYTAEKAAFERYRNERQGAPDLVERRVCAIRKSRYILLDVHGQDAGTFPVDKWVGPAADSKILLRRLSGDRSTSFKVQTSGPEIPRNIQSGTGDIVTVEPRIWSTSSGKNRIVAFYKTDSKTPVLIQVFVQVKQSDWHTVKIYNFETRAYEAELFDPKSSRYGDTQPTQTVKMPTR